MNDSEILMKWQISENRVSVFCGEALAEAAYEAKALNNGEDQSSIK